MTIDPQLIARIVRVIPEAATAVQRLADLDARASLTASELHELNELRKELMDRWPEASRALACSPI